MIFTKDDKLLTDGGKLKGCCCCIDFLLAFVGDGGTGYKLDSSCNSVDTFTPSASDIAIDGDNLYIASTTLLKKDCNNGSIWSYDPGNEVKGVVVDSAHDVLIATKNPDIVHKVDSDGNFAWSYDADTNGQCVAVDASKNVYVGSDFAGPTTPVSEDSLFKFNSLGVLQWSYSVMGMFIGNVRAITVDGSGNVYAGCHTDAGYSVIKLNSSGVMQWERNTGGAVFGVVLDTIGNLYCVGARSGSYSAWKITAAGSLSDFYDTGDHAYCVTMDSSGNIWIGGETVSGKSVWKINTSGVLQCSFAGPTRTYGVGLK